LPAAVSWNVRSDHPVTADRCRIITPQRKRLLEILGEYRYLSTAQTSLLLRPEKPASSFERGIRRMLTLLHRAGLVRRGYFLETESERLPVVPPFCYWLSRDGAGALDGGFVAGRTPYSLAHEIRISRFHIALNRIAAAVPFIVHWRQHDLRKTVNPDALFALTDTRLPREASTRYYFLEVERSRQGHYRGGESGLITKLRRYVLYRRSPECRKDWRHFSDFRVIVVLRNESRERNLLSKLASLLPDDAIWTTTLATAEEGCAFVFRTPCDYQTATHCLFASTPVSGK
jgi:hypothetical protein